MNSILFGRHRQRNCFRKQSGSALLLILALPAWSAGAPSKSELSQDITVKSRAAGAVGVQVAPPTASKPVIDEVLRSLSLGRGARAPAAERIRAGGDTARFNRPFPEPPFLALSPANIVAVYDEWTFEILDNEGDIVWKSDGVGMLNDKVDWDGGGPDGRLAVVAGRSYHYRFTGRRAGRAFVIESDPLPLKSFTHREYAGETRLEADAALFFEEGKPAMTKEAGLWVDALASRMRQGEPRADGNYKVELSAKEVRGKVAPLRAKLLARRLAKSLLVAPERVVVS
ncbi:MAG: hypothetical protein PHS14_21085, partial [Elusimicrobia bacterium]|nr:hypothetical protein [Elusimicrobiota bacterium]